MLDKDVLDDVIRSTAAQEASDGDHTLREILQNWEQDHNALTRIIPLIQVRYRSIVHPAAQPTTETPLINGMLAMDRLRSLQPKPVRRRGSWWGKDDGPQ